jgi:hypothetical protein
MTNVRISAFTQQRTPDMRLVASHYNNCSEKEARNAITVFKVAFEIKKNGSV